jgi:hypothetical protein
MYRDFQYPAVIMASVNGYFVSQMYLMSPTCPQMFSAWIYGCDKQIAKDDSLTVTLTD